MSTSKPYLYGFHTDTNCSNATTGIFYLNTNNGYTTFGENEKIDSVENRLIFFNSQIKHSGISSTEEKYRCLINLNYTS
jgi:Rps23 Pro-64 3,4-dihydroxylase Tpa1-like proline 4-hydroxylase